MSIKHWRVRLATFAMVLLSRFRERGLSWAVRGLIRRFGIEFAWALLLPVAAVGHLLGFRRINVRTEHIGHLSAEPDALIKELRLGLLPSRRWLLLAPPGCVSNQHLLRYWDEFFTVVRSPWKCAVLGWMSRHFLMKHDVDNYVGKFFGTQAIYRVNALWDRRPPVLSLRNDDIVWGRGMLHRLGVPEDGWFVAVHVREGGFLPGNEILQSHRNANIANAIPAMLEIVRRGGVCIRMGDRSMTPLPAMPGVIDYAHHSLKSDRLDVILCAKARFFLGCTSGLAFVSTIFGVPVAHANMIPIETLGIRYCDLSIPKLLWSNQLGRYLSFREIFSSEVGGYFFTKQYADADISIEENTADDIKGLVVEMIERLLGQFVECEEDRLLHEQYKTLFRPGHYSWGATSSVGIDFLRRHKHLLK
ncbi:MAG: hypothetical protein BWY57_00289 [Betaproteobacteria bacterium ADurb.Bin341]|nr:MAG: hypothetical protein BWY57_00289 [Betaproteobacteria bacterium ADurb.Bin341]